MGSVKFKDLKAYVRYDGSGRVVAGSLVFRKKKPKNGRWQEISSNLCCNANPSSTTTTTTQGGGGVTPTAFVKQYWTDTYAACNFMTSGTAVFYSASSVLQPGVTVFQDAALTIPAFEGWVISESMMFPRLYIGAGGVLSNYVCSFPINIGWSYMDRNEACSLTNSSTVYASSSMVGPYSTLYTDPGLTTPINYPYVAINGYSYSTSGGMLEFQQACVVVNSQTFYLGPDVPTACSGSTSQILYWNGTFEQNGTALYGDAQLTQPVPTGVYIVNPNTLAVYLISNGLAFANGFCGA